MALHVFYGMDSNGKQEYLFGYCNDAQFIAKLDIYRPKNRELEMVLCFSQEDRRQLESDEILDVLLDGVRLYCMVNIIPYKGLSCVKHCFRAKLNEPDFLIGADLDKSLNTISVSTGTIYRIEIRKDPLPPVLRPIYAKEKASPLSEDAYNAVLATREYFKRVNGMLSRKD